MPKTIHHLPKNVVAETLGWVGALGILSSYALLSLGIVGGNSLIYYILSGIGGFGLAVISYRHRAYQSFIVNTMFTILAVMAILRILLMAQS